MSKTLRDALPADWCAWFENEVTQEDCDALEWDADSACGVECLRIARLADYVMGEWLDSADEVRMCALQQMRVVCYG